MSSNKTLSQLAETLEHRILLGLVCEWKHASLSLAAAYQNTFKKPLFSIKDLKNTFGYWSAAKREICLSRNLVLNYPWGTVREVLRHEMAHQLAHEVFHAANQSSHGPQFQKACQLLRADPKASARYRKLTDAPIGFESIENDDKILVRIKKLMALAESRNQHEATAAMAKAHELINKYNIDLMEQNKERNFISVFLGKPSLRHFREEYSLAHLLQDFYFVESIWVSAYVLEKGKMGRVLEISGTPQNVHIAHYVHDYIHAFIDSKWCSYNKGKRLNRYRKTDFAVGIIDGFRETLESQSQKNSPIEIDSALIKIEDPLLQQYVNERYPRVVRYRHTISNQDDGILDDGMEMGKKLIISKGIMQKNRSRTFLIEDMR